jgi:hypothetical protein
MNNNTAKHGKTMRKKIGPIDGDPVTTAPNLDELTPHQRALRLAVINEFKARKLKKFVEKQVEHINTTVQVADAIRFLFDEHDRPPANAPLEDIIEERRRLEYEIKWFEAVTMELHNKLIKVKEIESYALDLLGLDASETDRE